MLLYYICWLIDLWLLINQFTTVYSVWYKPVWSCLSFSLFHFSSQTWLCHQNHLLTLNETAASFLVFTLLKQGSSLFRLGSFTLKLYSCCSKHTSDYWPRAKFILCIWVIIITRRVRVKTQLTLKSTINIDWGMMRQIHKLTHYKYNTEIQFFLSCCSPLMVPLLRLSSPDMFNCVCQRGGC